MIDNQEREAYQSQIDDLNLKLSMASDLASAIIEKSTIDAGIEILRLSDYGNELRFQTDADLVKAIFLAMLDKHINDELDREKK